MHESLIALIHVVASSGSPIDNSGAFKVAIVTSVGVVMAAAITAFASTFRRSSTPTPTPTSDNFTRDYINSLVSDQQAYRALILTHQHLREAVALLGHDPDHLIHQQEQAASS